MAVGITMGRYVFFRVICGRACIFKMVVCIRVAVSMTSLMVSFNRLVIFMTGEVVCMTRVSGDKYDYDSVLHDQSCGRHTKGDGAHDQNDECRDIYTVKKAN
jgi:hypothetical protein